MTIITRYLIALSMLLFATTVFAEVFCVDTAEEIQAALTTAASNGQDDQVQIVQGTYVGGFFYDASETQDLIIKGGFSTECATQRMDDNNTVVGSFSGRPLTFTTIEESLLSIEGLTIKGSSSYDHGGGIYISAKSGSKIVISNNWFHHNTSSLGGGGIAVVKASANEFGKNTEILIKNNYIDNNISGSQFDEYVGGGGLYINLPEASVNLENNVLLNNKANIVYRPSGIPRSSSPYGGGAFIWCDQIMLFGNLFSSNSAEIPSNTSSTGGAFYIRSNIAEIISNSIFENESSSAPGGYLQNFSEIADVSMLIENNEIFGNGSFATKSSSGGLTISINKIGPQEGLVILINNSIVGNTGGVALLIYGEKQLIEAALYNNLFFGNITAQNFANDLMLSVGTENEIATANLILLSNNFNKTLGSGYWISIPFNIDPSNIDVLDPLFINLANGDLQLQNGSPMIDAGYHMTPDLPDFDITGSARVIGDKVDIGAYEYDDDTRYNLTTSLQGNGFGRVTSNPAGIDCGNDCDDPFPPLNNVVLTGTPDNGSTFAGWSGGGCSGTAPCTVKMDADKTVTASFTLSGSGEPALNAAVLPYARAIGMGETATAFGTLINSGTLTATSCALALPAGIPATFSYQTTDAGNALSGSPNTPVSIPAGAVQQFVFGITPTATFAATEIPVVFDCTNSAPAPSHTGVNTFILSASSSVPADLVAIASTVNNDGIVHLDPGSGIGFFATAAVNIGSTGTIQVQADDGERVLPLTLEVCETNAIGQRIGSCASSLTRTVNTNETVYYTVNVFASQGLEIPFDPAFNRLYLRFVENGTTVGATNVAVTTE